jgi:hypothetical protein
MKSIERRIADLERQIGGLFRARVTSTVACRVYDDAAQTLTVSGTLYAIAFAHERVDTSQMHDTVTNNSRVYVPVAGWYLAAAEVEFAANSTGVRGVYIRVDGTTYIAGQRLSATSAGVSTLSVATLYYLTSGQYLEVVALQTSGGALDTSIAANHAPEFAVIRVA